VAVCVWRRPGPGPVRPVAGPGPVLEDGFEADLFAGGRAAEDQGCEPCFESHPLDEPRGFQ